MERFREYNSRYSKYDFKRTKTTICLEEGASFLVQTS